MDVDFTPEDMSFREEVRSFIEENYPKHLGSLDRSDMSKEDLLAWHKVLHTKGWVAPSWPAEFGGTDWTVTQRYIFNEESARHGTIPPMPFGVQMLGPVIYTFGNQEQKDWVLPGILSGEDWWCQGYSEPGAGSDLAALSTAAVLDGDEWVINGQKIWTSTAHIADWIFCLVRSEPDAPKHKGISFLLFDMKTPGIEVRPLVDMTGHANFNETFFTDVRVPKHQIVGERGQGWQVANAILGHERETLAPANTAQTRVNALIDLMKSETADGARLIDNPVYRDRLMKIQSKVMAMRFNELRVLSARLNPGQDPGLSRMITKLEGTELRHDLEGLAIDVMGEIGLAYEDNPYLRGSGSWQREYMFYLGLIIGGGTSQIQKNIISERGLGMPREPKFEKAS